MDITDFGASGNGEANDTPAIREAIASATAGDEIVFPSTDGDYLVSADDKSEPEGTAITLDTDDIPDSLTLRGEGYHSSLVMDGGHTANHIMLKILVNGDCDLTVRGLRFNANKAQNETSSSLNVPIRVFQGQNLSSDDDPAVLLEDIWAHNAGSNLIRLGCPGVVLNRSTTWDGDSHGINPDYNAFRKLDPPIEVRNCHSFRNGGYGCDASDGKHIIEHCVFEHNRLGIKNTANTYRCEWHRCRIRNNTGPGFQHPAGETNIGQRQRVVFRDCIFEGNGMEGLNTGEDLDVTIPPDSVIVFRENNETSGSAALFLQEDTNFDAEQATIRLADNHEAGLLADTTGEIRIGTVSHAGNGGETILGQAQPEIGEIVVERDPDLPSVPTAEDVGAKRPAT